MNAGQGDVTAAGLGAGLNVIAAHGDVHLNAITGSVQVHFSNDKGDFSAHQVDGDLTADGDCNDLTLSEIKGRVTINGDLFGDVHMENVTGPFIVHTSGTDLQIAALAGRPDAQLRQSARDRSQGPGARGDALQGRRPEPDLRRQLR